MSKPKIVTILDKKINSVDGEARALEKKFTKGEINQKSFMDEFIEKRKKFHTLQIMKVKVNQS